MFSFGGKRSHSIFKDWHYVVLHYNDAIHKSTRKLLPVDTFVKFIQIPGIVIKNLVTSSNKGIIFMDKDYMFIMFVCFCTRYVQTFSVNFNNILSKDEPWTDKQLTEFRDGFIGWDSFF